MKQYFMTTDRLGFGVWTENDLDLAANVPGMKDYNACLAQVVASACR